VGVKQIALVTGGYRGIGLAVSESLLKAGYKVYVNARSSLDKIEDKLKQLQGIGEAEYLKFDVRDTKSIEAAAQSLDGETIDLLVNNAGILKDNLLCSIEDEDWLSIIDTNFGGVIRVSDYFFSNLNKSFNPVVINMGSISGVRPRAGQGAYAVSKAMVNSYTKAKAAESKSVRYVSISPGPVATDMIKSAPWYQDKRAFGRIPLRRFAEPEEIGELVLLIAKEDSPFVSGENIVFDGGFIQTTKGDYRNG